MRGLGRMVTRSCMHVSHSQTRSMRSTSLKGSYPMRQAAARVCAGIFDKAADGGPAGPDGAAQAPGGEHSAQPDVRRGGRCRPRRRHARRCVRRAAGETASRLTGAHQPQTLIHLRVSRRACRAQTDRVEFKLKAASRLHKNVQTNQVRLALQADAMEHALIAALPLGPQSAAGGVSLPDSFIVSTPATDLMSLFSIVQPDNNLSPAWHLTVLRKPCAWLHTYATHAEDASLTMLRAWRLSCRPSACTPR